MAYAVSTVTSCRFADTSQMDNYFQWFGIIQLPSSGNTYYYNRSDSQLACRAIIYAHGQLLIYVYTYMLNVLLYIVLLLS